MKYILTGCAGFIGSNLLDQLLLDGHEVIGIDNLSSGDKENIKPHIDNPHFTFLKIDITDWNDLSRHFSYFKKIDGVFHMAAKARIQFSIDNPYETHNANVTGTFNILEMMKMCNIKNIVFSSTSSMYGLKNVPPLVETMPPDCLNVYSLSKFVSEQYLKVWHNLYGINSIILRFFNVYGPREKTEGPFATVIGKFYRQILVDGIAPTIVGSGEQSRDFTSVYDIVSGNIKAMEKVSDELSCEVFNLGSGRSYTVLSLTKMILDTLNLPEDCKTFIPPRPGESWTTLADVNKAKEILGWTPQRMLPDQIKDQAKFYLGKFGVDSIAALARIKR